VDMHVGLVLLSLERALHCVCIKARGASRADGDEFPQKWMNWPKHYFAWRH